MVESTSKTLSRSPVFAFAPIVLLLAGRLVFMAAVAVLAAQSQPLVFKTAIALPNVEGRIDHLAFDAERKHLFVAALGNDSVEVLDTAKGVHIQHLAGFHEPQGIAIV